MFPIAFLFAALGLSNASPDSSWLRRLEPYEATTPVGFAGFAPKGFYFARRVGDIPQLFHQSGLGEEKRVSDFKERVAAIYGNPNPTRGNLLLLIDSGGNENFRPYLYRPESRQLSAWPAPEGRCLGAVWSRDGARFAYSHSAPGYPGARIRVGDSPDRDRLVLDRPGSWSPLDFSAGGDSLLVSRDVSASESELWLLTLRDTALTRLLPGEKPQAFAGAFFNKHVNGKTCVGFISDRAGEFQRLNNICLGDSAPVPLSPAADADVEWAVPTSGGKGIIYALNQGGADAVFRIGGNRSPKKVDGLPPGIAQPGVFRPDGSEFALGFSGPETPGDIYFLGPKGGARLAVSASLGKEESDKLPTPVFFEYATIDPVPGKKTVIPAWLQMPPSSFRGSRPVLIQFHGGPELQARPNYNSFLRFCTRTLGLAVIQPNVRGSTGYGKAFQRLDDGRGRISALSDADALLKWIASRPELDSTRVAVMGRSYGGFMSLSALIRNPDRVRAAISGVGITHFPSFLGATAEYRRDLRRVEYGDERDPAMLAFLDSISPLNLAARIRKPVLLLHGRNDPRVPLSQSEKLFAALTKTSPDSRLVIQEGEGHGLGLKSHEVQAHAEMAEFLARNLGL